MAFVFGWYSFKIKSYSPQDLNLDTEEWSNTTFEVRQKVFHLFWLPFFSLGKVYARRKGGKLYDVPNAIIAAIKAKGKIRTPWYSFLLPILVATAFIGVGLFIPTAEYFMRRKSDKRDKEQYEVAINDVQQKLSHLTVNSYLRIVSKTKAESYKAVFLKVVAIQGNTYKCLVMEATHPSDESEKYSWSRPTSDTLTFAKSDIQKAVCTDYEQFQKTETCGFAFLGGNNIYVIDAIQYFDEPVIDGEIDWYFWDTLRQRDFQYTERFTGFKNDRSWTITLNLQNFGVPAKLMKIKNLEGNIKWIDTLPLSFTPYEYLKEIPIQGSTTTDPAGLTFKSVLTFQDNNNKEYDYIVEGRPQFFTIKRK